MKSFVEILSSNLAAKQILSLTWVSQKLSLLPYDGKDDKESHRYLTLLS